MATIATHCRIICAMGWVLSGAAAWAVQASPLPPSAGEAEHAGAVTHARNDGGSLTMPSLPLLGPKRILLVIGKWADGTGPDVQTLRDQVFSSHPRSLRSFVSKASGNRLELNEYRTLVANFGAKPAGSCDGRDMEARAAQAVATAGIGSNDYDYLYVVVLCQGGAYAYAPGTTAMFFGVGPDSHVWLHEYGHNLGIRHARTYVNCRQSGNVVHAPAGCGEQEFGDSGDPTGGGRGLYPAIARAFLGWLDPGQFGEISTSGLYRINALGRPGPSLYTIRVPGQNRYITLEYRQPDGPYDFPASDNRSSGLWIRYSTVAGTLQNLQLNATPGDASLNSPALLPGRVLVDETAEVSIAVCSADPEGAVFAVALDGQRLPSCDGGPSAPFVTVPADGQVVPTTPLIAGLGTPGAQVLVVNGDSPLSVLATTQVDARGHWQVVPGQDIPQGVFSVAGWQSMSGRFSGLSNSRTFVATAVEVAPPIISMPCRGCRSGRYPQVSGTALPGARVLLVKAHEPHTVYGTARADSQGRWSIKVVRPLPAGYNAVSARQTLVDRTSAWTDNLGFEVSYDVPVPVIQQPLQNARVPRGDIRVSGLGAPGAQLVVVPQGRPDEILASTTVASNGTWQVTLGADLPAGAMAISSRTWDNGIASNWADNRSFFIIDAQ